MNNFILHLVIFIAWIAYAFPPFAESEKTVAKIVHVILMFVLSACLGASLGSALEGVL